VGVFHENVDRRIALGMLAIVVGGVVLSWEGRSVNPNARMNATAECSDRKARSSKCVKPFPQ
jgi:drug/metabolite transporter (DMT)-like permease